MTRVAADVGDIGAAAARSIQTKLDAAAGGPAGRVALLDTALTEVGRARVRLDTIKVGRDRWTLPPLRGARANLAVGLDRARTRLRDASVLAGALRRMFVGPSRVLILAGNNAEMRSGGMPLSAGVAELQDGKIAVGGFRETGELFVGEGKIPVPRNLYNLYGWMVFGGEWRATTATPNFLESGPLYKEMAARAGLGAVDSVIFVDVRALRAVMSATGPVELDGDRYTVRNIERQLMNENYIKFGDPDPAVRASRQELQGRLGVAVFEALNSRPLKLGPLVSNLSEAGKGRHLLAWSAEPDLQMVWQRAGIQGALNPTGLMVMLQNITANKLDWYIRPRVALRTLWVRRGVRRVELSVTFTNKKRTRTSAVVEGTGYTRSNGLHDGEHRVYLVEYLPHAAADIAAGELPFYAGGTDGPNKVVGMRYGVDLGATRTVTISFSVPKKQVFTLIPSARAHPLDVYTPNGHYTDTKPVSFAL